MMFAAGAITTVGLHVEARPRVACAVGRRRVPDRGGERAPAGAAEPWQPPLVDEHGRARLQHGLLCGDRARRQRELRDPGVGPQEHRREPRDVARQGRRGDRLERVGRRQDRVARDRPHPLVRGRPVGREEGGEPVAIARRAALDGPVDAFRRAADRRRCPRRPAARRRRPTAAVGPARKSGANAPAPVAPGAFQREVGLLQAVRVCRRGRPRRRRRPRRPLRPRPRARATAATGWTAGAATSVGATSGGDGTVDRRGVRRGGRSSIGRRVLAAHDGPAAPGLHRGERSLGVAPPARPRSGTAPRGPWPCSSRRPGPSAAGRSGRTALRGAQAGS